MLFAHALMFDRTLTPDTPVIARWTNCGNFYTAPATVTKVNAKSVRVAISEAIAGYPAGHSIICPRPIARTWSWNNCILAA